MNTVVNKAAIFMAALFFGASTMPVLAADGSLEERVDRLERMLDSRNMVQVEMQQQIDTLGNEVSHLRGSLEEANHRLQQATERQKSLYDELDKLRSGAAAVAAESPPAAESVASGNQGDAPSAAQNEAASTPTTPEENQAYEAAVNLVMKERQYDKAIQAFKQFLGSYPDSGYAGNANYWLGQLLFNQGDQKAAKSYFLTVAQKFKDSPKRADAILKLGMITKAEGDKEKAGKYFQLVIKQYPNTTTAQMAQKELGEL